ERAGPGPRRLDVDRARDGPVAPLVLDPQDVPGPSAGRLAEGRLQGDLAAFPGDRERLGELTPPVEPGRLERIQAADLGPKRVGAIAARLGRLARPLAVDRDEGEERAAIRGKRAAAADRFDDRRVAQLPGPAVHPAVTRRRRAPPAEGAVGVAAGRD